ncbi:helical backbone metal receptor [Robertkochia solimangrovi]|uniref:helical backbone metal receptor n=1 Tax=Robertkochia solimangrovi TaxID=2213046 RepID=UPI00117E0E00|nr:helical backbone metal receptor [Robertkochia solimangrovi]TRZ43742.1 cobalamin-binding protein [Robertkochia solimangrovi]
MAVVLTDATGCLLKFDVSPVRIISLVPSLTELLVDLGLKERLVGITKFCVHPKTLKDDIAIVGGTKQVDFHKISALKPDIIICNKEENTEEIVATLRELTQVHVSDINDLDDVIRLIEDYGVLFGTRKNTTALIDALQVEIHNFSAFMKGRPVFEVLYLIWRKPWMTIGGDTFIHHMLSLCNLKNIFGDLKRYPLTEANYPLPEPDFVFMSSEPFPFKEKHKDEVNAVFGGKPLLVDGEFFSWYGSRLLNAFDYFKDLRVEIERIQAER